MTVEKPCANMKRSCKLKAVISFIFASRMCSNQRVFPNKKKNQCRNHAKCHIETSCTGKTEHLRYINYHWSPSNRMRIWFPRKYTDVDKCVVFVYSFSSNFMLNTQFGDKNWMLHLLQKIYNGAEFWKWFWGNKINCAK